MSNRLAKLPPDPGDIQSLRAFRARNEEIAEFVMEVIRIAAPGAKAEAATATRQAIAAGIAAPPSTADRNTKEDDDDHPPAWVHDLR